MAGKSAGKSKWFSLKVHWKKLESGAKNAMKKKFDAREIDTKGAEELILAILKSAIKEFKRKYRCYRKMKPNDATFERYEKEVERAEKDLTKTIEYWGMMPLDKSAISVVEDIKSAVRKEIEEKENARKSGKTV